MYQYFKKSWGRTREDEFQTWGKVTWFVETDEDGFPKRKIEVYENGNRIKYHQNKPFDDYGGLGNLALDLQEFSAYTIDQTIFEEEWKKANPKKEHQEIINLISRYLSDHYSQRFGQALFNLGINEFVNKMEPMNPNNRLRDIYNDSDEVILERIKTQINRFDQTKNQ